MAIDKDGVEFLLKVTAEKLYTAQQHVRELVASLKRMNGGKDPVIECGFDEAVQLLETLEALSDDARPDHSSGLLCEVYEGLKGADLLP